MRSTTAEMQQNNTENADEAAAKEDKLEKLRGYKARKARFYRSMSSWVLNLHVARVEIGELFMWSTLNVF